MEEIKIPLYLNRDDAPEKLSQVEAFDLHNTRPTGTGEQEQGYLANIESTELITDPDDLASGINLTLGAEAFKNVKKAYALKYNSTGYHIITETDYDTLVEETIFTDLTDTGGVQLFNLSPDHEFNDLKLLHDEYLITADGQSGVVYCINIERLKSGGYGAVITQDAFNLLKAQPLKPIKAEYVNDPNKKSNLLKGKLFQFRPQGGFADYMMSAWGTISKRPIPELESTDSVGDDPSKLNAIKLTVDIGDELTKTLRIAARAALYDWYVIKEVTREYVLALPDTEIDIENEIYEAYNPTDNTYTFLFYNDGQGEPVAVSDTDEYYDNIPQNVGAIEIVNGDIVVLGDIEEGYDRPTGIDVNLTVTSYNPQINVSIEEDPRNFTYSGNNKVIKVLVGQQHRRYVTLDFYGVPKEGDIVKINLGLISTSAINQTVTYTVTAGDDENMTNFINNLYNILPNGSATHGGYHKTKTIFNDTHGQVTFLTVNYQELKNVDIDLNITGSLEGKTVNILKSNSSYQLALAHFDKFGRPFPIVTNDVDFVAPTSSYAETEGLVPQIGWEITEGTAPEGAVSYQWLITENTKYLNNLFVTGIYDTDESEDDFIVFNLASLARYAKDGENGIVAYEYTEGDRVTFIHNFDGSSTPEKWFNTPPLDFAVAGFEIKVETVLDVTTVKYLLKIKKSSLLPLIDLTAKEVLLELYTPKNNNLNIDSKIFYEIGEQFDIVDGEYSVTSGVIRTGDAYIRPRKYLSNVEASNDVFAFPVEDFNFSDDYESKFWSAGRGRTYNDEVGKVHRKASFRYSGEYNIGSLNNEINRFYASRIYGDRPEETSSIYGAITKMVMRQTYLIVLQETDVAHIPVFTSIIEDQTEQANLAISSKLFNNARYVGNGLGTGLAKKVISVSNNGTVYFVDPNNGYPCRDGFDGVKVINNKMKKFFIDKLKGVDPKTLIGTFDDFNNEWNISFTGLYGQITVIPFTAENWEYLDDYNLTVADVTIVPPPNGTTEIDVDGNIVYTPDEGYVGTDTVGIVFIAGSTVINKNACITIEAGTVGVDDFSFIALFNQELEQLLESNSNFLQGSTIPVSISISAGGEYRIRPVDGVWGAWTSVFGTIEPNSEFQVRLESSADWETLTTTTLTISDKSAPFNITTRPEVFAVPNDERSGVATKDNCASGTTPVGTVTYIVPAGTYTASTKAEANALAEADVLANKQAYANANGTCTVPTTFTNDFRSQTFYKECTEGEIGTPIVTSVEAGTYSAPTKAEANALADAYIVANGQANANAEGMCNVPTNITFEVVMYNNYNNARYSNVDSRAKSFELTDGSGYSTTIATIFVSTTITRDATVHTFSVPISGTSVAINGVRGFLEYNATSVSQSVTEKLLKNGTTIGNGSRTISAGNPTGTQYTILVPTAISSIFGAGDVLRLEHGTPTITTYYSAPYSASIARNNCPTGQVPVGTVTLTANYGDFTSTVSQLDADNQAISYVEANKQANANLYGTCEVIPPEELLYVSTYNNTTGTDCIATGVTVNTETVALSLDAGESSIDQPVDFISSPSNVTASLSFGSGSTKAFYYAEFFKNGVSQGIRSYEKNTTGVGSNSITYTGMTLVADDEISVYITFQPYEPLGFFYAADVSDPTTTCGLFGGDSELYTSNPSGALNIGDKAFQRYDSGLYIGLVPAEAYPSPNNYIAISDTAGGVVLRWARINPATGEVLEKEECSGGGCNLMLSFVSKTDESIPDANDGSITVNVSTSNVDGWVLSKDGGANYLFTGTSPYTFTNLSPGSYSIKAINGDGSCETGLESSVEIIAAEYYEIPCGYYLPEAMGGCSWASCGRSMFTTHVTPDFEIGDTVYAFESGNYILWKDLSPADNTWMTYFYLGVKRSVLMNKTTSLVTNKIICP